MPPATSPAILPASRAGIAEAARQLAVGNLVVLPTETIYGIAVNLKFPDARRAARNLKTPSPNVPASSPDVPKSAQIVPESAPNSARNTPWVIHVATPEALLSWVPNLTPTPRRLISKALPGPVALQIKLHPDDLAAARARLGDAADEVLVDGFITLRCPDISPTQDVLSAVQDPVAIIGAGTPSHPGVFAIADLPPGLVSGEPGGVVAALDGGPTKYRKSSTLLKIEGEKYSVIRPGVIDERILDRFAEFMVLFICSGNTCRSPMASALASKVIADGLNIAPNELYLRRIAVQSAGVHAARGMRATLEAVEAVKELGADLSSHVSQPATVDLLRRADVIYTMTKAHREAVLELLPGAERKTFPLDPEGDVSDPIGSSFSIYQQVASRLSAVLRRRLAELSI